MRTFLARGPSPPQLGGTNAPTAAQTSVGRGGRALRPDPDRHHGRPGDRGRLQRAEAQAGARSRTIPGRSAGANCEDPTALRVRGGVRLGDRAAGLHQARGHQDPSGRLPRQAHRARRRVPGRHVGEPRRTRRVRSDLLLPQLLRAQGSRRGVRLDRVRPARSRAPANRPCPATPSTPVTTGRSTSRPRRRWSGRGSSGPAPTPGTATARTAGSSST